MGDGKYENRISGVARYSGSGHAIITLSTSDGSTTAYADPALRVPLSPLKTDVHGRYEFFVKPGTYVLTFAGDRYDEAKRTIPVGDPDPSSDASASGTSVAQTFTALQAFQAGLTSRAAGGGQIVAKPSGDASPGLINWQHDDATGGLLHFTMKANSGANTAAIMIGTDKGSGGALLLSHKNSGSALHLTSQPGSGLGAYLVGHAVNPVFHADLYARSGGMSVRFRTGAAYADGVTTQGSTTFTSDTAAFVAGDVGQVLSQLATTGDTDPMGAIPSGTTIASVTNATTVVMSQAAAFTATGVRFMVAGRATPDRHTALAFYDNDGTTMLGRIHSSGIDFTGMASGVGHARAAATFRQKSGQSGNIVSVLSSAGEVLGAFMKNGHLLTRVSSAPADADLTTGDLAWWFDSTAGAAKVMFKAKDAGGTVRTASLAMA